jgi:serine protease inhibitor
MKPTSRKSVLILLAALLLVFQSCKKESAEVVPVEPVPIALSSDQISLIVSENSFALDIFKKVIENNETSNVIISPLSISSALSMAVNGASSETREAMLEALRLNGLDPEVINNSYKELTEDLLKVDKRVLISVANSIWTENNFVVKKPFADILSKYYNTESKAFDITDPEVTKPINSWIESKTNGLIKNMLSSLDPQTVMLLINAIYFKGQWNSQFEKDKTVNESFYKPTGEIVSVPMMKQKSHFRIYRGESFAMAEFPYGQGNYVMDVILPDDNNGIKDLLPLINTANLTEWTDQMNEREIEVYFPKFKYAYKKELKDILTDMGMGIAFNDGADFSNISDMDLCISFVLHQAFIETNEEGTEAAAATIVGIVNTSMPAAPFIFNMDHSFLYIIRETTTNSILFI